ncbi:hypothetical protein [Streptomyces sp. NPDC051546]|uniref:hypothetical protein n=1 Tax=Streptomyces sp. NPDC051546 TaxID=3365655 RepID=UPI0037B26CB6
MILILGLIILIIASAVALMGIFGNTGAGHGIGTPGGDFSILGYPATGSTGSLFLSGIIVGAAALLGLALVTIGARRSARDRHPSEPGPWLVRPPSRTPLTQAG